MKPLMHIDTRTGRGFTLLEVLIAVVVLATGLLALTALQGALIRSSADAKARSHIAAYASSEIDRIRSGGVAADKTATSGGTDEISETAFAAGLSQLSQTVTVTPYVYDSATGNFVVSASPPGNNAFFRRISLQMNWTDATGDASRQLRFDTDVSPLALTNSKVLVDRTVPGDVGKRPVVRRESPLTEGMIPIATGGEGDEATAATNPKPELLGDKTGTYVADTRFNILTYSKDSRTPDGFARFNRQIETAVVGCECTNDTSGFTDKSVGPFLSAMAFRPAVWTGRNYADPKPAAAAVSSSPATESQSELCDVCCRDHKDPTAEQGPKFSPWPNQTSDHYNENASREPLVGPVTSGTYIESCRVIRVNGVWRVTADPKIVDNALVATKVAPPTPPSDTTKGSTDIAIANNTSATSPALSDQGRDAYVMYAYDSIAGLYFDANNVPPTGKSVDFKAIQAARGLDEPLYVPILLDDRRWMHGRIFLVDYLVQEATDLLKKAAKECTNSSGNDNKSFCVLPYLPIATINTTEISNWAPRKATAEDPKPDQLSDPDLLPRLDIAASRIRSHNSGIALFKAINPNEFDPAVLPPASDEQLFVQVGADSDDSIPPVQTPSPNPTTARLFGDPGSDPMRGYAQTCGLASYLLDWTFPTGGSNPETPFKDTSSYPSAFVGGGCACTPDSKKGTPSSCIVSDQTKFSMTAVGYNRFVPESYKDPCTKKNVTQPTLYCYVAPKLILQSTAFKMASSTIHGSGLSRGVTFQITGPPASESKLSKLGLEFATPTAYKSQGVCENNVAIWTEPDPSKCDAH